MATSLNPALIPATPDAGGADRRHRTLDRRQSGGAPIKAASKIGRF
jgi:hypothetical protein